jgi:hypothetical protein
LNRLFFTIVLSLNTIGFSYAQQEKVKNNPTYDDKPIHFGYTIGVNAMDFTFGRYYMRNPKVDTLYADLTQLNFGFQVGIISDFRIGEYFNVRILPGFNFGQRNLQYFTNKGGRNGMKENRTFRIESSMLDLPILIKYKAKRINNYRPYLITGSSIKYDLAAKKKYKIDQQEYILLKPFDVYWDFGLGIDFYLPYFKFSTELKVSYGFLDILNHKAPEVHPEYLNALRKLNSQIIMLSFHFE